tara:strand:- start:79 stop:225 length:147 start_codon:yes stop_codon:yes gene_type:complete
VELELELELELDLDDISGGCFHDNGGGELVELREPVDRDPLLARRAAV